MGRRACFNTCGRREALEGADLRPTGAFLRLLFSFSAFKLSILLANSEGCSGDCAGMRGPNVRTWHSGGSRVGDVGGLRETRLDPACAVNPCGTKRLQIQALAPQTSAR